jgi:DNA-binding Lrp family transcriptional regulator
MDEIDLCILKELVKDGQMPLSTIAKKLGVSPETVRIRYGKMRKERTITHGSVTIDLSKLGYQGKVFLMIKNAPNHDKSKTINALKKIRNIFIISEIIGDFEIIAIAPVKDLNGLKTLVNRIKKLPSVNQVEVTLINDTVFPVNTRFGELFLD